MGLIKSVFRFLLSRRFWVFVGIVLLCGLIWQFGSIISIGTMVPLASELSRLITIGVILILWLFSMLLAQLRAAKANQVFVAELVETKPEPEAAPGEENVAEINEKFQSVLTDLKRSKLGHKTFLRDMPWYAIIGPPGTGKTTALRQSGLNFPFDFSDDLQGIGGTRNCDWFFTEDAVLIDTAGRYVQQESDPEVDAAEWLGFLDLLKKHRGRRALNGVILTLSVEELNSGDLAIREHGREIRKRLSELRDRLEINLPVYLVITKADLVPGFEAFFGDLTTRDREQVWGTTLTTDARVDATSVTRELNTLSLQLEKRLIGRLATGETQEERTEIFRFPTQFECLSAPLNLLVDTIFGESRFEQSAWMRGIYFTSATQEGSPVDRLVSSLSASFGVRNAPVTPGRHGQKRSFFLHDLLSKVVFAEAGLGTFDAAAEERRKWIWRGSLAGTVLVSALAGLLFSLSFFRYQAGINDQASQFTSLQARLANVSARQAPIEPLDLNLALDAVNEVANSASRVNTGLLTALGPKADAEIEQANKLAYQHGLRNILEPRMQAILEATMRRKIRDPEYMLGALKTYQMMTGLAPFDVEFAQVWWVNDLPLHAPIDPFPTDATLVHQLNAMERLASDPRKLQPDNALVGAAVNSICTIPLSVRAYKSLQAAVRANGPKSWIPAEYTGPNATRVLSRVSKDSLRVGIDGFYTFAGFHQGVQPALGEVAAQAILDRTAFSGGCSESSDASVAALSQDVLKLYYEDYIAKWDGFLRDVRLSPVENLRQANENLKDLSSTDSALKRLLASVVKETDLAKQEEVEEGGASQGVLSIATKKLGKVGKLLKRGDKLISKGKDGVQPDVPGQIVSDHFKPIRAMIEETDGVPPLLDDVVLALKALANELQTVAASPDPEAALLARGGLPQLTGEIANQATNLPDPVDDWLKGIAGDTVKITREAVIAQLRARWRADVLPFCTSATAGRYPFDQSSAIDINIADFKTIFGPGGMIDSFTNTELKPYIDMTRRPWSWRADLGLDPATLEPFQRARAIRDGLFPGGAGPVMAFTLEPKDLSPNASRVTLNLDGQQLVYFNAAARPQPMTWPGKDGTNMITLSFAPIDGSPSVLVTETGNWAWLRMIRKGRMTSTSLPELFKLKLRSSGFSADFELRANSVDNPFDLQMFGNFRCPRTF